MGWMKLELPEPDEFDEAMEVAWEDHMWWIYQNENHVEESDNAK